MDGLFCVFTDLIREKLAAWNTLFAQSTDETTGGVGGPQFNQYNLQAATTNSLIHIVAA